MAITSVIICSGHFLSHMLSSAHVHPYIQTQFVYWLSGFDYIISCLLNLAQQSFQTEMAYRFSFQVNLPRPSTQKMSVYPTLIGVLYTSNEKQ